MLSRRAKKMIAEFIDRSRDEAVKKRDLEMAAELQEAKRLLGRGAKKVRRANPYIVFTSSCLKEGGAPKTKRESQLKMQRCALRWREMTEEERRRYDTGQLVAIDYS